MSTITQQRQRPRYDSRRRSRRGSDRIRTPDGRNAGRGAGTLEDLVVTAMDRLVSAGSASCPVCAEARLTPAGCAGCGSHLS